MATIRTWPHRAVLVLVLESLSACATGVKIPPPAVSSIPVGLTMREVEVTIALAVGEKQQQTEPMDILTGDYRAVLIGAVLDAGRRNDASQAWFVEERGQSSMRVGTQVRSHYLSLAIDYTTAEFTVRIVAARNLEYSGDRIHENALVWVEDLNARIRRYLSAVLTAKLAGRFQAVDEGTDAPGGTGGGEDEQVPAVD